MKEEKESEAIMYTAKQLQDAYTEGYSNGYDQIAFIVRETRKSLEAVAPISDEQRKLFSACEKMDLKDRPKYDPEAGVLVKDGMLKFRMHNIDFEE